MMREALVSKSGWTMAALALVLGPAGSGPAAAYQMTSVDRRLLVAMVCGNNVEAAEDALQSGANINHRNEAMDQDTLLIAAVRQYCAPEIIKWLLEHGADPKLRNDEGRTALSYVLEWNSSANPHKAPIVKMLKEAAGGGAAQGNAAAAPAPVAFPPARVAPQRGTGIDPITGRGFAEPPAGPKGVGGPPPVRGVYECYGQNAAISMMAFGILNGSTYMSSQGRQGRYAYNPRTGILTLDPGRSPARYQRISATSFRVITPSGQLGGFVCPLNRSKNPQRPPW